MKMTKILTIQDLRDNLVDILPLDQREYKNTQAYENLCIAFYNFVKADSESKAERKQELSYIKEIFEHMCLTQLAPTPTIPSWERNLAERVQ